MMSQSNSTPATIIHPFDIAKARSPMALALLVVAAVCWAVEQRRLGTGFLGRTVVAGDRLVVLRNGKGVK